MYLEVFVLLEIFFIYNLFIFVCRVYGHIFCLDNFEDLELILWCKYC